MNHKLRISEITNFEGYEFRGIPVNKDYIENKLSLEGLVYIWDVSFTVGLFCSRTTLEKL